MNAENEILVKRLANGEYKIDITFEDGNKTSTVCGELIDVEKSIEDEIRKAKGHL